MAEVEVFGSHGVRQLDASYQVMRLYSKQTVTMQNGTQIGSLWVMDLTTPIQFPLVAVAPTVAGATQGACVIQYTPYWTGSASGFRLMMQATGVSNPSFDVFVFAPGGASAGQSNFDVYAAGGSPRIFGSDTKVAAVVDQMDFGSDTYSDGMGTTDYLFDYTWPKKIAFCQQTMLEWTKSLPFPEPGVEYNLSDRYGFFVDDTPASGRGKIVPREFQTITVSNSYEGFAAAGSGLLLDVTGI